MKIQVGFSPSVVSPKKKIWNGQLCGLLYYTHDLVVFVLDSRCAKIGTPDPEREVIPSFQPDSLVCARTDPHGMLGGPWHYPGLSCIFLTGANQTDFMSLPVLRCFLFFCYTLRKGVIFVKCLPANLFFKLLSSLGYLCLFVQKKC
jgi:hypothetical protein